MPSRNTTYWRASLGPGRWWLPPMGASEGEGSPLAGRAQPRCSCSLASLGAPASLKLHLRVFLIWEELGRGRLHRCAPPCSPTTSAGWPEPPDRGCPLRVSWGFLTPISALQVFPSADGTASSKAPFFCNSCSSHSLCLVQRKPRVCSQWLNHAPRPFGKHGAEWALGPGQHAAKKRHCMQKISNIWDKAST